MLFLLLFIITYVYAFDTKELTLAHKLQLSTGKLCEHDERANLVCLNPVESGLFQLDIMDSELVKRDSNISAVAYDMLVNIYGEDRVTKSIAALELHQPEVSVSDRGYFDCEYWGQFAPIKRLACHTAHGATHFMLNSGAATMGNIISNLIIEAFSHSRGDHSPRSICRLKDGEQLCVSWADYSVSNLQGGTDSYISKFALQCLNRGGSSKFQTTLPNGGELWVCVSDRPN